MIDINRLSRRGKVTIAAEDGVYHVEFKAPGPYNGRAWCTSDEADLFDRCRLGAKDWRGEGTDLDALLVECEQATRPDSHDVDDLVWLIERRRDTRTLGPPLPSYRRWYDWSPGQGRWLRTFDHAHEYLDGYLRDLKEQHTFDAEHAAAEQRRHTTSRFHARRILA